MKAQLAASIHRLRRAAWIALPLRAAAQFNAALMPVHGAAIAYVTLFSLAPLLLVLLGVGGLLFDSDSVRVQLLSQLDALVGRAGADALDALLRSSVVERNGLWASVFGVGLALFAATRTFAALKLALVWVYFTAQIVLFGAAFAFVHARRSAAITRLQRLAP
jgi:membrane protein